MEEFPVGRSRAPEYDRPLSGISLGIVKFPDESRQYMRTVKIKVVIRTVKIGGHNRNIICFILSVIGLACSDTCYLGDGIRFIGWLQLTGQEIFLFHWLGAISRIN